jgi:hypothetical protein
MSGSRRNGRICALCGHVRRIEIELALAAGVGQKAVARQHGISKHVVHDHWHKHIDPERRARLLMGPVQRAALEARVSDESRSVLDNLLVTRAALYERLEAAMQVGDDAAVWRHTGRLHENFRLAADITGEIQKSPMMVSQTNIYTSPAIARLESFMLAALEDEPSARVKLLRAFQQAERAEMGDLEPHAAAAMPRALPAIEHQQGAPDGEATETNT